MASHNSFYEQNPHTRKTVFLVCLLVLITAGGIFLVKNPPEASRDWGSFALIFVSIVLEAIPFMLTGALVGGCLEVWVSHERMAAILPRQKWIAVCVCACAGIFFPVCECAVVPVVRRLVNKGLPLCAAIAYLLGGPVINPIVAASTAMAYAGDLTMPGLRIAIAFVISVVIGLVMDRIFPGQSAIVRHQNMEAADLHKYSTEKILTMMHSHDHGCSCCSDHCHEENGHNESWIEKLVRAVSHAREDFLSVGHYLIIGAFIAALAHTHIDRSAMAAISRTPMISILIMMGMAIALNLCSEADAFIAASFQNIIPVNAQLAFLLTGPMFDIKLLLMYRILFTPKAIVVFSILILSSILLATGLLETMEPYLLQIL